jgi:CHASE1-domain containing sensor protein
MSDLTKSEMPLSVFKIRLLATVILLNLLVYSLARVSLYQSRINYEKKAAVSTQNLTNILDLHIKGEIDGIDNHAVHGRRAVHSGSKATQSGGNGDQV